LFSNTKTNLFQIEEIHDKEKRIWFPKIALGAGGAVLSKSSYTIRTLEEANSLQS
jgi:hypothetical protein